MEIANKLNWKDVLRLGAGTSDFELNIYQAWAEMNVRPSVIRQGYAIEAQKFWTFINTLCPEMADDQAVVATDHVVTKQGVPVHLSYYFLRAGEDLYITFSEFTPEYDEDVVDNADMVQRAIGDLNIYYRHTAENHRRAEGISAAFTAIKWSDSVLKNYLVVHPGLGGYRLQLSQPPADGCDLETHFGGAIAKQYEAIALKSSKPGLTLFHGEEGTGGDLLLRQLCADLCDAGMFVVVVPNFLHTELERPALAKLLQNLSGCALVIENAQEILADEERAKMIEGLTNNGVCVLATACEVGALSKTAKRLSKGRRIATDDISAKLANVLALELGIGHTFDAPVKLNAVYDMVPDEPEAPKRKLGLGDRHR